MHCANFLHDALRSMRYNVGDVLIIVPNTQSIIEVNTIIPETYVTTLDKLVSKDKRILPRQELIMKLYDIYTRHVNNSQLHTFWSFGASLINDYDMIDRCLIDADCLFSNVKTLKAFDSHFSDLPPEQQKIIRNFWDVFSEDSMSKQKIDFLNFWDIARMMYYELKNDLMSHDEWYLGMCYRHFCKNIASLMPSYVRIVVIGFNALYKSDERIIKYLVKNYGASVFWDIDDYYISDVNQEAGYVFRSYMRDVVLSSTFKPLYPSKMVCRDKMTLFEYSTDAEQCAFAIDTVNGIDDKYKVGVVVCDEALFTQLVAMWPKDIVFNSSFGYPVDLLCVRSFLGFIIMMYHAENIDDAFDRNILMNSIKEDVRTTLLELVKKHDIPVKEYFIKICTFIINSGLLNAYDTLAFRKIVNDIGILDPLHVDTTDKLKSIVISFLSEIHIPICGNANIHIVRLEDTANMSFDYVVLLGVGDHLMHDTVGNSLIPYSIRRGYGLPTRDTFFRYVESYYFYRLLHSSKEVFMTCNIAKNDYCRYIQQLKCELPCTIDIKRVTVRGGAPRGRYISIFDKSKIAEFKNRYVCNDGTVCKVVTPTMVNTYLNCKFQFYCKYVLGLKEPSKERQPLGSMLHNVMKVLYEPYVNKIIEQDGADDIRGRVSTVIQTVYNEVYGSKQNGESLIEKHIIYGMVNGFINRDLEHIPIKIVGIERKVDMCDGLRIKCGDGVCVLGGIIDRIDIIDGTMRVIDYKTGDVKNNVRSVDDLFDDTKQVRNEAVLQIILYTLLLNKLYPELCIRPQIVGFKGISRAGQSSDVHVGSNMFSSRDLTVAQQFLDKLKNVVGDMFSMDDPCKNETHRCQYCPYQNICKYSA